MKRLTVLILIALIALIAASSGATEKLPTAQELMSRIDQEGGKKVLDDLWESPNVFKALLKPLEKGDPAWFQVWLRMRKFSDAGASESIDMSFGRAIPLVPEQVLRLIHSDELSLQVCGSPFIKPEPGIAETYEHDARKALASVRDPEFLSLASKCREKIRHTGK
jgi:hypothetical protein